MGCTTTAATPPHRPRLSGELVARVKLAGSGRSTAQIIGSLDGQAQARLRNGTLSHLSIETAGLDLAEAMCVMVRGDRALPMQCALVELELSKGVMSVQRAVVDSADSSLHMLGRIDLNDEALDLRLTVHPKGFSLFSMRAPVTVTGTLAQPVVAIEGKALAGRAGGRGPGGGGTTGGVAGVPGVRRARCG